MDWPELFDQYGIEYATSGPNVGRGRIAVKCPFCGDADPSQHMSVDLAGQGWRCWRNHDHRGRSPVGLIRALLRCSAEEARRLAGIGPAVRSAGLADRIRGLLEPVDAEGAPPSLLREPTEFRKFTDLPSARPFLRYLEGRGFPRQFVLAPADLGLRYAVRGGFGGRVVFLVHDLGNLVTWTGRTISRRQPQRYKALPTDEENAALLGCAPANLSIGSCLLWQDELLAGGNVLCISEGPMDALKLRMLGWGSGVRSTAVFTNSISDAQMNRLRIIVPRFQRSVLLLDRGAEGRTMRARQQLAALGVRAGWLPDGVNDPGELSPGMYAKLALANFFESRQ